MILTTTNSVEDYKIFKYQGIVSGSAVNMPKMTMSFSMEKYYSAFSETVAEVKEKAFLDLKENAEKLNANAVVGIKVDVELTTSNYILVTVTGTAVNIMQK
ncbi:YbjQ family protein [Frigoriflavimonas asaccharolytica]|uniref:Uncharacterized protein YbjQ (UPF0145 family) n=1 Tax=Frigoriflavimonas asaccharolytica TaxID=2735899 RepID=A0A8J8KB44_9FLAO|nr:heavy metal-binding domain-containing protein [Frigoriflavimonas asaccharolytica]NRS92179.1 uncharacterized protein YbjQ (UPF0145 family) [Frigoriflavimonas asaccharolytica]